MGKTLVPIALPRRPEPDEMLPADMSGREIIVANVDGQLFAFVRQCPHEDADLLEGELGDRSIRCNNHSYCFDLTSGECTQPPGGPMLTTLPVEEADGQVCIRLEW